MITKQFDIAIIGAGPAGCAAALGLANSGLKVTLIDKASFPREKSCGDAIPGPAIKTLNSLFPFFEDAFIKLEPKHRIRLSRIMLGNGRSIRYYWKLPAYNIKRSVFDQFLLDQVKEHTFTEIITDWPIKEIKSGEPMLINSIRERESISAMMIIGCDGAGSVTAKSLGHQVHARAETVFASRAYYKGVELSEDTNLFYILKKYLPGYFWAFPLGSDIFNVGLGVKTGRDGKVPFGIKEALDEFIRDKSMAKAFEHSEPISEVSGAMLPIGGRKGAYSGTRYLLAGDAAYLADPLQGHGIDKAVVSGLLAAHHSINCFKEEDFSAGYNGYYDLAIRNGLERELRRNRQRQLVLSNFPSLLKLYAMIKK